MSRYVQVVALLDVLLIAAAVVTAFSLRTEVGFSATNLAIAFYGPLVVLPLLWVFALWIRGVYETRIITLGAEEFRRIVSASIWLFAGVAAISYLFKAEFSRFIVFVAIPLGTLLVLINHRVARSWLHSQRRSGRFVERLLIVASATTGQDVSQTLSASYQAGLLPVGVVEPPASLIGGASSDRGTQNKYLDDLAHEVALKSATAMLLTPSRTVDAEFVKRLSWDSKFSDVDLYLAPQLTDVTGPRTLLQGVPDLPFIHLESPELSEGAKFSKRSFDLVVSLFALVLLAPLLLLIALGVVLTSRGGPIFSQVRVGEGGRTFKIFKFRTMYLGADSNRATLREQTKQAVGTFKMADDPRVTPFGRFLRRWSLDELPQLVNVFFGAMSVVGPRPHPADDVERYAQGDEARLEIKPGLTGLQQVSGRSDLSWEDSVRADLRYIENWSFSGDLLLILRTFRVVASGRGAY